MISAIFKELVRRPEMVYKSLVISQRVVARRRHDFGTLNVIMTLRGRTRDVKKKFITAASYCSNGQNEVNTACNN